MSFLVGPHPNFRVEGLGYAGFFELVLYLALGAVVGAILGGLVDGIPGTSITPTAFAIVGMGAALATATRASFTGVLLTIETTGALPLLLRMTVAVFGAAFVTHALQTPSLDRALGEPG